jgi:hypothetical protein
MRGYFFCQLAVILYRGFFILGFQISPGRTIITKFPQAAIPAFALGLETLAQDLRKYLIKTLPERGCFQITAEFVKKFAEL